MAKTKVAAKNANRRRSQAKGKQLLPISVEKTSTTNAYWSIPNLAVEDIADTGLKNFIKQFDNEQVKRQFDNEQVTAETDI